MQDNGIVCRENGEEGISMLTQLWSENIFIAVVGICGLGIVVKLMIHHTYQRLLRAASDIGHSNHRLMKVLCMKFETCYQLKIGVPNVSLFVEKYLRHYRVFGINMKTWEHVNMISVILVMVCSMGTSIWGMMTGAKSTQVFLPLLIGVVGTGFLLFIDFTWNTENQWKMLQVDITDYLENVCKPRLENETFHPAEMKEYQRKYFADEEKVVPFEDKQNEKKAMPEELSDFSFTQEEEKVIREVIHEYLG